MIEVVLLIRPNKKKVVKYNGKGWPGVIYHETRAEFHDGQGTMFEQKKKSISYFLVEGVWDDEGRAVYVP